MSKELEEEIQFQRKIIVKNSLAMLDELQKQIEGWRRCLQAPRPGYPIADDLTKEAIALGQLRGQFYQLATVESESVRRASVRKRWNRVRSVVGKKVV